MTENGERERLMKQTYARLLSAGIAAVTMLTFAFGGVQGAGGNAIVAFAETSVHTEETEAELENTVVEEAAEETNDVTETTETATETRKKKETVVVKKLDFVDPEAPKPVKVLEFLDSENAENKEEKDTPKEEIALPEEEYKVLLRIVQAEAGNCDIKGKILVANVILNRMESEKFPNTVRDVVYQRHQFSPVSNGSINRCKVTGDTIYAVDRALNGEDPSEGALYFMNRRASAGSNVRWFDNHLDFLFKHEQHEFFK